MQLISPKFNYPVKLPILEIGRMVMEDVFRPISFLKAGCF
jgi:hypothetical protein